MNLLFIILWMYKVLISLNRYPNSSRYSILHLKNGATESRNETEAVQMAQEYIGSWLYEDYLENNAFPKSSSIENIIVEEDEFSDMSKTFVSLVGMDIADYVRKNETKIVRKNVLIPSYLNELAKKRNLNFSQILQEALLAELNRA